MTKSHSMLTFYVVCVTLFLFSVLSMFSVQQQEQRFSQDFAEVNQQAYSAYEDLIQFSESSELGDTLTIVVEENDYIDDNMLMFDGVEQDPLGLFIQGTSCVGENELLKLVDGLAICCGQCDADVQIGFDDRVMCSRGSNHWVACDDFASSRLDRVAVECTDVSEQVTVSFDGDSVRTTNADAQWGSHLIFDIGLSTQPGEYTVTSACNGGRSASFTISQPSFGGGGGGGGGSSSSQTTQATAPVALVSATPSSGFAPLTVSFDGSLSTDDGSIVSYAWDFDGDGTTDATTVTSTYTYTAPQLGGYVARLTVTDDSGLTDSFSTTITVFDVQPDCIDGQDNDGDGLIDLFDPGCANYADSEDSQERTCRAGGGVAVENDVRCNVHVARNNGAYGDDFTRHGIHGDFISIPSSTMGAPAGTSFNGFFSWPNESIVTLLRNDIGLIDTFTGTYLVDIEYPLLPADYDEFYNRSTDTFNENITLFLDGYKRRIEVLRQEIHPNATIMLYGHPAAPGGNSRPANDNWQDIVKVFQYFSDNGLYDNVDFGSPLVYHRFGVDDVLSNYEYMAEQASHLINLSQRNITKSDGTQLPVVPVLSFRTYNGGSANSGNFIDMEAVRRHWEAIAGTNATKMMYWSNEDRNTLHEFFDNLSSQSIMPSYCLCPNCSDGRDNDGDNLVDYPVDPGCFSADGDENEVSFTGDPVWTYMWGGLKDDNDQDYQYQRTYVWFTYSFSDDAVSTGQSLFDRLSAYPEDHKVLHYHSWLMRNHSDATPKSDGTGFNFGDWFGFHPRDKCLLANGSYSEYSCPFFDNGQEFLYNNTIQSVTDFYALGGDIDHIMIDYESAGYPVWNGRPLESFTAIVNDPRFVQPHPAFGTNSTLDMFCIYDSDLCISGSQDLNATKAKIIDESFRRQNGVHYVWNAVLNKFRGYYLEKVINDTFGVLDSNGFSYSNWEYFERNPNVEAYDPNGHPASRYPEFATGTHQAPTFYGKLFSSSRWESGGGLFGTTSGYATAFHSLLSDIGNIRTGIINSSTPLAPWINWIGEDVNERKDSRYYEEGVFHLLLHDPDYVHYWWNPSISLREDLLRYTFAMEEVHDLVSYLPRYTLVEQGIPLTSDYALTGIRSGNRSIWRFTPENLDGSDDVLSLTSIDNTTSELVISTSQATLRFTNATLWRPDLYMPINEYNYTFGIWIVQPYNAGLSVS